MRRMAFDKFKVFPGKALKFVADAYNSYKLAELEFKKHGMDFDVTQVGNMKLQNFKTFVAVE